MSAATALLRSELDRFADQHELTTREYDVVFLLLCGLSTVAQIAERLGLSQNTVHNHFKNVFRRTGTNSKAALLALFLKNAIGHQAGLQPFLRRPRVLVVDPDAHTSKSLHDALQARGMHVEEEPDSARVLSRVAALRIDVVIADASLPGAAGKGVLADVTARYGKNPLVLLTSNDSSVARKELLERGAGGVFAKPVALDRLVFTVLEHLAESPFHRSRLFRVETEDMPARVEDRVDTTIHNLGFGGAFIPLRSEQLTRESFLVGQRVNVAFALEDSDSMQLQCEVMWRRPSSRPSMQSGIGVRFLNLADAQRAQLEDFVRKRKLGALGQLDGTPRARPSRRPQL